jgi:hypothetical protein
MPDGDVIHRPSGSLCACRDGEAAFARFESGLYRSFIVPQQALPNTVFSHLH